jgi:hypothetical protein
MKNFILGNIVWKNDKKEEVIFVPNLNGKFKVYQNKKQ